MTKEELIKILTFPEYSAFLNSRMEEFITIQTIQKYLGMFFNQNVVIPKGENRHPYADVLHAFVEGAAMQYRTCIDDEWEDSQRPEWEYRIKPSEPVYEYRVRMNFKDKSYEYTHKYFTKQEFDDFGFPSSCELSEETKSERKQ